MMLSLFATGKADVKVGTILEGTEATYIDKNGNSRKVSLMLQVISVDLKRYRVYGSEQKNCFSYNTPEDYEGEVIIPEKIGSWTITAVGKHSFHDCKAKITLPESITEIEDSAFYNYKYTGYDFALPSKVRYIGKRAFGNARFRGISLPNSLQNIDDYAFMFSTLEELVLPKSTYVVGTDITWGCYQMERLEVESGCANYSSPAGSNVIMENKQYTIIAGCRNSKIPAEARRIAPEAFKEVLFTNPVITIPESVGVIGKRAFYNSNVKRLIVKGETVDIQEEAFRACVSLERIDIHGGNVSIGRSAFETCLNLFAVWCYSHTPNIKPYARQFYDIGPDWKFGKSQVKLIAKYPDEYNDRFDDSTGNLVWQNWFETPILYTDSYDYMRISEVHLTDFDWPVAGSPCDVTATSLTSYATVSEISYAMNGRTYSAEEAAGYNDLINIGFTITLGNAPHGQCEFTDDVKLYVDGKQADFIVTASGNTLTQKKFVFADYRVPAPPGGVPIKTAYVSVPEPVAGQPLSNEITNPTGIKYNRMSYVIDTVFWAHAADASLDSYDPTKAYTLVAFFTAKENYCFGTDCTFRLNSKDASVIRSRTADGRERVMVALGYGNEPPVEPDTIYITDINVVLPELVEGEVPSSEIISPTVEDMNMHDYELYRVTWSPDETPYDKNQEFEVRVRFKAKGEYTFFAPDINITINGQKATLYGSPAGYFTTNNNKQCTVSLVFENFKKGDVNRDGDVNTGDVTAVYSYIINGAGSGFDKEAADVNLDGDVNTGDVTAIYSIIINGGAE